MRYLAEKAKKIKFRTLPWSLWIMSFLTLIASLMMSYNNFILTEKEKYFIIHPQKTLLFSYSKYLVLLCILFRFLRRKN